MTGLSVGELLPNYPTRSVFSARSDQGTFVVKVKSGPRPDAADAEPLLVLDYLAVRKFAHAPGLVNARAGGNPVLDRGKCRLSPLNLSPGP